jgi:predicted nucleotidyltransferase
MDNIKITNLKDLKEIIATSSISETVNSYILANNPICFDGKNNIVYELRKMLSDHFEVHLKNIEIVGSAKLGISLNPSPKRYGKKFGKDSDIDLVIVSNELFDIAWHELIKREDKLFGEEEKIFSCYKDIPMGIISPNKLPIQMEFSKKWWGIFESLSSNAKFENRKIRGRLFKDWWFVEKYYSIQLANLSK